MFGLVLAGALGGCETDVEIEVPAHTPKLTVQFNLNTEEPNQSMFIGRSQTVLSGEDLWRNGLVKDATVAIRDKNGVLWQGFAFSPFDYNPDQGLYRPTNPFTPEPGQEYALTVQAPGFEAIESRLVQPAVVPVNGVSFQPDRKNDQFNFSGMLRIQFKDIADQRNYYRLFVKLLDDQDRVVGNVYTANDNGDIFGEEVERIELFKVFDDGWARQDEIAYAGKIESYIGGGIPPTHLEVTLQHITADLYLYERSKNNYQEDNPFAEPLNLHSNVRNGYGTFGGITATRFKIRL